MRNARRLGSAEILILMALTFLAAPGWSQSINGLADGKTANFYDVFLGRNAGLSLAGGDWNTGVGYNSLRGLTTGSYNTANGAWALRVNVGGGFNTATGAQALEFNFAGSNNSAYGGRALQNNLNSFNTAIGNESLRFNTTGFFNSALGANSLLKNTTGSFNSAVGGSALANNTTAGRNTGLGYSALVRSRTGGKNVAVGWNAGGSNKTGIGNVFLGHAAGFNSAYKTLSNRLIVANTGTTTPLIAGNFKAKTLRVHGAFSANTVREVSDVRLKTAIAPLQNALSSVMLLEGKTYEWRRDEEEAMMPEGRAIGLIAQEVEEVLPELVSEGEDGFKGIEYSKLTAVLVEAIKQQQLQIDEQRIEVEALRSRVAELELR